MAMPPFLLAIDGYRYAQRHPTDSQSICMLGAFVGCDGRVGLSAAIPIKIVLDRAEVGVSIVSLRPLTGYLWRCIQRAYGRCRPARFGSSVGVLIRALRAS
jgi:hypothetical protein